jgi:hypothetical protein
MGDGIFTHIDYEGLATRRGIESRGYLIDLRWSRLHMRTPDINDPIPAGDRGSPDQEVEDGSSHCRTGLGCRGDDHASFSFDN